MYYNTYIYIYIASRFRSGGSLFRRRRKNPRHLETCGDCRLDDPKSTLVSHGLFIFDVERKIRDVLAGSETPPRGGEGSERDLRSIIILLDNKSNTDHNNINNNNDNNNNNIM